MHKKKIFIFISVVFVLILGFFYFNSLNFKLYKFIFNKNAKVGIAVLKDNHIWFIRNDNYPLLSVFKYIVALKVLDDLEKKNISLDKKIKITEQMVDKNLYSPMLYKYNSFPFYISISELLRYMISESDNIACDILIDYSGGINEIQNYIHKIGFNNIQVQVNEKDMNKNVEYQYLNNAKPVDIVKLIKTGYEGKLLSKNSTEYLNKIMLETNTGKDKLKAGLQKGVLIGHKTGSSSRKINGVKIADNDTGFIILPNGEIYYITVFIKDSTMTDSQNADLIRSVSQVVFKHFYERKTILGENIK